MFPLIKVHCSYLICTGHLIAISNTRDLSPATSSYYCLFKCSLQLITHGYTFEDRVAYIDACMLGVYCLNGKAVFIMIDQGNDVGRILGSF